MIDDLDRKILSELQRDSTLSLDQLAAKVGSSRTPVWNRIRKLREAGVIKQQVAILDPESVGLGSCFFVLVRTSEHEPGWLQSFMDAVSEIPHIIEAHRLAGEIDYILKVRVHDAKDYDRFYKALVSKVRIYNVTSLLSMEEMKNTTELPLDFAVTKERGPNQSSSGSGGLP